MTRLTIIIAVLVLVTALAPCGFGQVVYGQKAWGGTRAVYSSWTIGTKLGGELTLSQFYIPVSGMVPLKDNLEMQVYLGTTSNTFDLQLVEANLSGLTDLSLQVNQSLYGDQVLVSGGVNIPTGKTNMTLGGQDSEWWVMEALSQDYLNLPSRKLGTGFGANLLVGGAAKAGEFRLGGTVSYQFSASYEPYEAAGDYNPGDAFAVSGSVDRAFDKTTVSASGRYTAYMTDTRDDVKVMKQAPQTDISVALFHQMDKAAVEAGIRYLIRGRNTVYNQDESVLTQLKHFGNEFDLYLRYILTSSDKWRISPTLGMMRLASNELTISSVSFLDLIILDETRIELGSSTIYDIGIGVTREVSEKVDAGAGFRLFTGTALGELIDISGYQFTVSLTASM